MSVQHTDAKLPRRLTDPTPAEFVEDSWAMVRSLDDAVSAGEMTEHERSLMLRALLAGALDWIRNRS